MLRCKNIQIFVFVRTKKRLILTSLIYISARAVAAAVSLALLFSEKIDFFFALQSGGG